MTKPQRLGMTADAFMAALVACGFKGPWRWSNVDWEPSFRRVWHDWPPQQRDPDRFPSFRLGGHGRTSEPRELLWQLKRTSPFHNLRENPLTDQPFGLSPREFLEIWADAARPDEWVALAHAFLDDMARWADPS
jgi:hypothetical protein